ncbi:MAG: hypothetical protein KDA25_05460 [Phycisphaerales bacterium]|nr:hypothetical protein [Phycisphaerales bacterium]
MVGTTEHPSSIALRRFEFAVILCCGLLALALVGQIAVWSVAALTDVRFDRAAGAYDGPPVVDEPAHADAPARAVNVVEFERARRTYTRATASVEPVRLADGDRWLSMTSRLGTAIGRFAAVGLLLFIALGAIVAAIVRVLDIDRIVTSFVLAMLLAVPVLPGGSRLVDGLVPCVLGDYPSMIAQVDAWNQPVDENAVALTRQPPPSTPSFILEYAILPVICLIAVIVIARQFSVGVRSGIDSHDALAIDPELEREAANMRPTSLLNHGRGRLPDVLTKGVQGTESQTSDPAPIRAIGGTAAPTSATTVAVGRAPKRII